ncbi:switch-associated protein 70-like isoform X1 [Zingiber officinale]|uniref:PH domain-containing protein n=2 Tax=Zingiber officinale TaxID=94328 RepID=A0A8J5I456_ZINOF|nr:switch-associated protein 70-like isoform X1 [Zingiber officinale]KAG6536736.1 hypothetical protein ZIOFF_001804 [Zingiber officinale]
MASNGRSAEAGNAESSLEKIKRQLTSGSGKYLLQGPLLKRSETLRKWNERWVILDPTTGKMEYKIRRNEPGIKGTIMFDSNSVITNSPINFHGLPKYDGCCFYIGTPQKKEYFFCAETPGAAKAWVSTLHATQLVLRAHREAVNNLSGSGSAQLGTVATVVAAANSTAMEASKEIEAAMKISLRTALGSLTTKPSDGQLDDLTIMKETLRVKDEELHQLAKDIRARDSTIKDITDKLLETAEAAEAAASAAHAMNEERRLACADIERLRKDAEKHHEIFLLKLRESEEKVKNLTMEQELLLKQRDSALQEAHMWRSELAKARERAVVLEAAVVRAEERARITEVDSEARVKDAVEKSLAAIKEKEDLLALVHKLQSQVQRFGNTKQAFEERSEAHSTPDDTLPMTKHVDLLEDDVDKACLNDPRPLPASSESEIQLGVDGVDIHSVGDANWDNFQSSAARIADVREISPEAEGNSLDISVDTTRNNDTQP